MKTKTLIKFYTSKTNSNISFLIFLAIVAAAFEFVGIGLLIPILQFEGDGVVQNIVKNSFLYVGIELSVINLLFLLMMILVGKFFIFIYQTYKFSHVTNFLLHNIRCHILSLISKSNYLRLSEYSTGALNNIVLREVETVFLLFSYGLQTIAVFLFVIVYLVLAFLVDPQLTIFMAIFGVSFLFIFRVLNKILRNNSYQLLDNNEKLNQKVIEFIQSLKYILATNSFGFIKKDIFKHSELVSHYKHTQAFLGGISKYSVEPIGLILVSVILLLTLNDNGSVNIEILLIAFFLYKVFSKMTAFQMFIQKINEIHASVEKILGFQNNVLESMSCSDEDFRKLDKIDSLFLKELYFEFGDKKVLSDISMEIKKGKVVGIVGTTGSGKSTLLNVLTMLYPANEKFYINGFLSSDFNAQNYQDKIGYVSQDSLIFEDTIKNNIVLDKENYSRERFDEVIKLANLTDFIKDKTVDTMISGFGSDISGGQKQRISIARELYKNPQILILDEATSSLDANTERDIVNNILNMKNDKIIIIVAHQLATLRHVDEIFMLDGGSVADSGNFKNLYNLNKKFQMMCNNQNIYFK